MEENIEQNTELAKECVDQLTLFDKVRKNSHKDIIPVANLHHV